jgi:DNA-binding HxlR family transcriptional regulator
MSDITPKMLTQTLKELEEDDLIHREAFKEIPPRVEYSLTHMGHQLIPFIILLRDWGKEKMEIRGMIPIPPKDCVPPKESALALVM